MMRKSQISWVIVTGLLALAAIPLLAECLPPSPTPKVIATRGTLELTGKLEGANGCYRVGKYALGWPPEFQVTVIDDTLRVVAAWGKGPIWEFRFGDHVVIGGMHGGDSMSAERRDLLRIPSDCPGPYFVFGSGPY